MNVQQAICSPLCSLILIAGSAALACSTAAAGDPNTAPQRVVAFGDVNLDHAEGVKTLYQRLSSAARAVCRPDSIAPYVLRAQSRKCASTALANAVATIDNPNLTAYVDSQADGRSASGIKLAARR